MGSQGNQPDFEPLLFSLHINRNLSRYKILKIATFPVQNILHNTSVFSSVGKSEASLPWSYKNNLLFISRCLYGFPPYIHKESLISFSYGYFILTTWHTTSPWICIRRSSLSWAVVSSIESLEYCFRPTGRGTPMIWNRFPILCIYVFLLWCSSVQVCPSHH